MLVTNRLDPLQHGLPWRAVRRLSAPERLGAARELLEAEVPGVWIWWSLYCSSSEPIYDGASIAAQGIVVVSINYRLGALGFMKCEGGDANCGLWDAIGALEWTHENIHQFSGDSNNITISGESAGAIAVTCLVASPIANGLFRRGIAMSAVAHSMMMSLLRK